MPMFASILRDLTDVVGKYRVRSKDTTIEEIGTNDERVLNGLPSGYKDVKVSKIF